MSEEVYGEIIRNIRAEAMIRDENGEGRLTLEDFDESSNTRTQYQVQEGEYNWSEYQAAAGIEPHPVASLDYIPEELDEISPFKTPESLEVRPKDYESRLIDEEDIAMFILDSTSTAAYDSEYQNLCWDRRTNVLRKAEDTLVTDMVQKEHLDIDDLELKDNEIAQEVLNRVDEDAILKEDVSYPEDVFEVVKTKRRNNVDFLRREFDDKVTQIKKAKQILE